MILMDIDSSALTLRDYTTLPKGKYLLIVEGLFGNRAFVPVDKLTMDKMGNVHGYRNKAKRLERIIVFHGNRSWYLVDASYVEVLPFRAYMERAAEKTSDFEKFAKALQTKYDLKEDPMEKATQVIPSTGLDFGYR